MILEYNANNICMHAATDDFIFIQNSIRVRYPAIHKKSFKTTHTLIHLTATLLTPSLIIIFILFIVLVLIAIETTNSIAAKKAAAAAARRRRQNRHNSYSSSDGPDPV
ncbi:hypothetical protein DERF_001819 [Dermatophagoides farinae]|uniref:Uncharacterized protein n=1 Tax=Dermatophagoides farinae TaxID=6954 RepID=A0A922IB75_DERFA|nr:hypothetical protein DERF_001819 [Dermatophagoides farinae]